MKGLNLDIFIETTKKCQLTYDALGNDEKIIPLFLADYIYLLER